MILLISISLTVGVLIGWAISSWQYEKVVSQLKWSHETGKKISDELLKEITLANTCNHFRKEPDIRRPIKLCGGELTTIATDSLQKVSESQLEALKILTAGDGWEMVEFKSRHDNTLTYNVGDVVTKEKDLKLIDRVLTYLVKKRGGTVDWRQTWLCVTVK